MAFEMTPARARIVQTVAALGVGCAVIAVAVWTYILLEGGYRLYIAAILAICVVAILANAGLVWIVRRRTGLS